MLFNKKQLKRFWRNVEVGQADACWLWKGKVNSRGYGAFSAGKLKERVNNAHRAAFVIANGYIPKLLVCHRCNNKLCVNPKHFYLATDSQNLKDAWRDGLIPIKAGETLGQTKLTTKQVHEIRNLYNNTNITGLEIAKQFQVSQTTVRRIVDGKGRASEVTGKCKRRQNKLVFNEDEFLILASAYFSGATVQDLACMFNGTYNRIKNFIRHKLKRPTGAVIFIRGGQKGTYLKAIAKR